MKDSNFLWRFTIPLLNPLTNQAFEPKSRFELLFHSYQECVLPLNYIGLWVSYEIRTRVSTLEEWLLASRTNSHCAPCRRIELLLTARQAAVLPSDSQGLSQGPENRTLTRRSQTACATVTLVPGMVAQIRTEKTGFGGPQFTVSLRPYILIAYLCILVKCSGDRIRTYTPSVNSRARYHYATPE